MKMKRLFFIALLFAICLILVLSGCKKGCFKNKDKVEGIIESEYDFGECFRDTPIAFDDSGYVISDDSTLQALALVLRYDKYNKPECESTKPKAIDFSKHTLLGKYAMGGCSVDFIREVTEDVANQRYIYSIRVLECGLCKKGQYSLNWVLVPKLPTGYPVEFEVKYK